MSRRLHRKIFQQKSHTLTVRSRCWRELSGSIRRIFICPICDDDRQYVPESGQTWTTHSALAKNYVVDTRQISECLFELKMSPEFAIGQRSLMVIAPGGNILWDCFPLLDEKTLSSSMQKAA